MSRRILLGTGWKMNKTVREAVEYAGRASELLSGIVGLEEIQLFVVPPFTAIDAVKRASGGRFWVGAQNMHWAESGAFTGEISAPMLQELGVDLVELGHAERRRYFNETDQDIQKKVDMALQYGLRPLLCVGEESEEKAFGVGKEAVAQQLKIAFRNVPARSASRLIVAYEPVWAIGERAAASVEHVRAMNAHIRELLDELFGAEGASVPVIYGGSVDADNCPELLVEGRCDGLFVGRAAWSAEGFARLAAACAGVVNGRSLGEIYDQRTHSS
jgi:L-erythrulose 1-phosphate isomerase